MNLSFAGCGFLGIYHVGVAVCFRKYAPHLLLEKISGASAGALAACCLLCDLPIGGMTSDVLRLCTEARSRSLGAFSPSFNIQELLLEGLEKFLPEDAHLRVNGKLHISLTRCHDGQNVIVSHFNSREELLQALLASSFIPVFSGLVPPKFQGLRYMDGGFSNNLPSLDENTITVSPFCGESDICPRDNSSKLFHINVANTSIEVSKNNICRIYRILFPPKPECLSDMCKQGFDDALRFLHRNNLISCTRCLSVQSTFVISETFEESLHYDPECTQCKEQQEEALLSNMPDTVMTIFQEAIDSTNKGLLNWIFKHRGMKLVSFLSLPYTVPVDLVYATLTKFTAPRTVATTSLWDIGKFFLEQFVHIMKRNESKKASKHTAKISCQLDYREFNNNNNNNFDWTTDIDDETSSRMNMCVTLDLDDNDTQSIDHVLDNTTSVLNGASNVTIAQSDTGNEESFEHILNAASNHDAIMSYYYMDENNKVKVTEIFDLTDSDSAAVQTAQEQETNRQLEFDDDWNESAWTVQQATEQPMLNLDNQNIADLTLDQILNQTTGLFTEPESEWSSGFIKPSHDKKITDGGGDFDKLEDDDNSSTTDLPESDQDQSQSRDSDTYTLPYPNIPSFNYEELDI